MQHNPATLLDMEFAEVANLLSLEASVLASRFQNEAKAPPPEIHDGPVIQLASQQSGISDQAAWLSSLVSQAKAIDGRLSKWPDHIPQEWFPISVSKEHIPPSVREAGLYGDHCDAYPDIMVTTTWNEWRSARLKVLALIARYEPNDQVTAAIQSLVDGICASLPFVLGDRKGMTIMWDDHSTYPAPSGHGLPPEHHRNAAAFGGWYILTPMRETTKVAMHLRPGQLQWVLLQMQRLARIYDVVSEE